MSDFDEDSHPRDDAGKFSGVGGATAKKQQETLAKFGRVKRERKSEASATVPVEASVADFKKAFTEAFKDSEFANHVTHYTEDQLKEMKLFIAPDGNAGVAVHDHGDGRVEATALFSRVKGGGAGLDILDHVIEHAGANYVECYGPKLNKLYEGLGFKVVDAFDFDPAQAASSWNFERFDHPKYHTMKLEE